MTSLHLVLGAGSGIGRSVARILASRFPTDKVIAVSRTQALLQETASGYNNIVPIAMDIARLDTAWDLVDIVQREHDAPGPARVRNLCHLASAMYAGPFAKLARTDWQQSIDTMATSRVFLTQALLSNLREGRGRVLFISADSAVTPRRGAIAFCAAQAASRMVALCLQQELHDIPVGIFKPGPALTPMLEATSRQPASVFPDAQAYMNIVASGKATRPAAIAQFVLWLLTATSSEEFASGMWDIREEHHHASWQTKEEPLYTGQGFQ